MPIIHTDFLEIVELPDVEVIIAEETESGFTPELAEKFSNFMNIIVIALVVVLVVFAAKTFYKFLRMLF